MAAMKTNLKVQLRAYLKAGLLALRSLMKALSMVVVKGLMTVVLRDNMLVGIPVDPTVALCVSPSAVHLVAMMFVVTAAMLVDTWIGSSAVQTADKLE